MSEELEAVKQVVTHPLTTGTGAIGLIGWLANKVYRGMGHRMTNMENASKLGFEATWKELDKRKEIEAKLFDLMREHEEKDTERFAEQNTANRDRHDELMSVIGDLRADIAGFRR